MTALIDHRIVWDFDEHKAAGKLGGDDFLTKRGEDVEAPVEGWLTMSGTTASIRQADNWRTVLLELGELVGARSRYVHVGDVIAHAGAMFVHAHDLAPGDPATKHTRSRWITSPLAPAGGDTTPVPATAPRSELDMILLFIKDNCDGNGHPGWWWVSPVTGKSLVLVSNGQAAQDQADSWARTSGDARPCSRQDALNLIAGIQQTSAPATSVGGLSAADLAAIDKLDDDENAQILTAINGVDEATLATFGLKRI